MLSVTSLQRKQAGPPALRYQSVPDICHLVVVLGSCSGNPGAADPDSQDCRSLFREVAPNTLNSLPASSHALVNPVQFWMSSCTDVEIIDSDPFKCQL